MLMNKPVYLGWSILEINEIVMHEFWFGCVKPLYGEKAKLCYIRTNGFAVYIKAKGIYVSIAKDIETRFDTSSYELEIPSPEGKNEKILNY